MKLTFVSNYINHHQIPLSSELYKVLGADYTFIQTEPVEQERLQMGWKDEAAMLPYVKLYQDAPEESAQLIMDSDVVIFGGTDDEALILPRIEAGKPVLRYSERIYKTGRWKAISPRGLRKKYHDHIRFRKAPVYLLCAGAYVASDFALIHAYLQKMLKWGYFPAMKQYDVDKLIEGKYRNTHNTSEKTADCRNGYTVSDRALDGKHNNYSGTVKLLWAGRFIDWKHPEMAVLAAEQLRDHGYHFRMDIIGGGAMEEELHRMVQEKKLSECVHFLGFQTPEEVRAAMEEADIYLFTSDEQEGWGAVLNEAMNSGCAVVASHAMGATPYLVKHRENGLVFQSRNFRSLMDQLQRLLDDPAEIDRLGRAAVKTIVEVWNAKVAAQRVLQLSECLVAGQNIMEQTGYWNDGPCTVAKTMTPRRWLHAQK